MDDQQKQIEMEAEMSRFEAEINLPLSQNNSAQIISANTYTQVQQHLQTRQPPAPDRLSLFSATSVFLPHQLQTQTALSYTHHERSHDHSSKPSPVVISAGPKLFVSKEKSKPAVDENKLKKQNEEAMLEKEKKRKIEEDFIAATRAKEIFEKRASANRNDDDSRRKKSKRFVRVAGGQVWEDSSLSDWDNDDFRIFCGDLGNDVTDDVLTRTFNKFPSFLKAKVIRDRRTNKTKGYGFVSFKDPQDFIRAMKEMNGKYVGSRPIKLRKSSWRDRNIETVHKKAIEKVSLGVSM